MCNSIYSFIHLLTNPFKGISCLTAHVKRKSAVPIYSPACRTGRFTHLLIYSFITCAILTSCDKARVFEENQQITNYKWSYDDAKTFVAEIKDTSQHYNLYVNVRHSFQFEWRNAWVKIQTTFPDGKSFEKRVNLVLSEPDGHWNGDCLGDNCDIQVVIQNNAIFPQPGKYTFKIAQDMRVNPLTAVKSVGLRIEKVTK